MIKDRLANSSQISMKISWRELGMAVVCLTLVGIAAIGSLGALARLQSNYSVSQFLPKDHPLINVDKETRRQFFLDQTQPLIVTLDVKPGVKGDWIETARLRRLQQATLQLKKTSGTTTVLSLANIQSASHQNDQLTVGSLLSITNESQRRARVRNDRILNPSLVSGDARKTVIVIGVKEDLSSDSLKYLMSDVREELMRVFPEASVSLGGVQAIQSQLGVLVKSELIRFTGLALFACCLALFVVFSSRRSVVIPFAAILLSNIFVLAFMAKMGISMTVLAVTIPILVSVTVLSLCIHTMLRLAEEAHVPQVRVDSVFSVKFLLVIKVMRALFLPNLLTSLTTCLGFATLILTDVPVIHDFGFSVAVSIMISFAITTFIIGPLMLILPVPAVRKWVFEEAQWAQLVMRARGFIVPVVAIGCVVLAYFGQNLHWSGRLFDDLPKQDEVRRATEEIDKNLGGTIPYEVVISNDGIADPWNDPKSLSRLDQLLTRFRVFPEVGSAVGLPDLLRFSIGKPSSALPSSRAAIAENWFLISMAEDSPLKKFLTVDGTSTRLSLRLRDLPGDRLDKIRTRIEQYVKTSFPGAKVTSAGMATTIHRLNNGLSQSLITGYWEALAVITILLCIVFRSVRWTLVAILPNLVPAAALVGILALTKTPMKPGVALVFSIALGIAFNNTVYLLQRLRLLIAESGGQASDHIERTLRLEGNPCMVASVCLLAGFGTFLLSQFGINQTFGAYMLISLFFGIVGDLVFLPALIRLCPWILETKTSLNSKPILNLGNQLPLLEENEMIASSSSASVKGTLQPRSAASIIVALMTALLPTANANSAGKEASDANFILKNVERGLAAKDERVLIKMKVVESNGSSKEREVEIKRKSGGKNQVLVRLKSPTDVSGVGLLSVSQGGNEDQWLYMPSQKKARRMVSGNKTQRFLDTEFNIEDFSAGTYARFVNKVVSEERAPSASVSIIESKSKSAETSYSKIKTWVDLATYQVQKSEYFDREGKLLKTMVFRDYKKFGTVWRAQTVEVRNMQTQRSTILKVAGLKLNSGLHDREFTQSALEQED